MNEVSWKRLLNQIRDGYVIPVLGSELLVDAEGVPLQRRIALALLAAHEVEPETELPAFHELNAAVALLKSRTSLQDLYADIDDALCAVTAAEGALPAAIRQLAEITDFRLFVTLTPDDLLARCLRRRCAVTEIVHSPKLPSSESRDLDPDWRERPGEAQVLYLFGKSRPAPMFAIHDEDILEYAHNLMSHGSQVPAVFLGELQERNLLLIGCDFPDWLSRFFLRVTNKSRLSEKTKREWLIDRPESSGSLVAFLSSYSKDTEVLTQQAPPDFVAELHRRWLAGQDECRREAAAPVAEVVPPQAMFFISYSRSTDLPRAEALYQTLLGLGAAEGEIWFDRKAIDPGQDFSRRILSGIGGCRYFLPLLSDGVNGREEAFVFREWRQANERLKDMNREFVIPVIVDADYEPERYTAAPVQAWSGIDFAHAPGGVPDARTTTKFRTLLRNARRGEA